MAHPVDMFAVHQSIHTHIVLYLASAPCSLINKVFKKWIYCVGGGGGGWCIIRIVERWSNGV